MATVYIAFGIIRHFAAMFINSHGLTINPPVPFKCSTSTILHKRRSGPCLYDAAADVQFTKTCRARQSMSSHTTHGHGRREDEHGIRPRQRIPTCP